MDVKKDMFLPALKGLPRIAYLAEVFALLLGADHHKILFPEYSCAVKPHVRSDGNRQSGTRKPLSASLLA